jgi:hypothetical protein
VLFRSSYDKFISNEEALAHSVRIGSIKMDMTRWTGQKDDITEGKEYTILRTVHPNWPGEEMVTFQDDVGEFRSITYNYKDFNAYEDFLELADRLIEISKDKDADNEDETEE